MSPRAAEVAVGDELPELVVRLGRADLVRYAGASGDLNPIHWNDRFAREVGLPGVIVHGMLTMGAAVRAVTAWTGDPGSVREYGVKFTRPVAVPDPGDAELVVHGKVAAVLDDGLVRVDLTVLHEGAKVLGQARAVVALP